MAKLIVSEPDSLAPSVGEVLYYLVEMLTQMERESEEKEQE